MIRFFLVPWIMSLAFLHGLVDWSNDANNKVTSKQNNLPISKSRESEITNTKAPWIENAGQWEDHVLYVAHTFSGNVIVNKDKEIIYALPVDSTSGYVLKERFIGKINNPKTTIPFGENKNRGSL